MRSEPLKFCVGKSLPVTMADTLWNQLGVRLDNHNLCYSDLPESESLLYGTLEEFGFYSFIDRAKLRKEIN